MSRIRPPRWTGYVAAGLILTHAALSYYWAAGGMLGTGLLTEGMQEMAEDRVGWFVTLVWAVAILKTLVGAIAVGFARQWTFPVPRWMPILIAWGAGAVLTLYALVQLLSLTMGGLVLNDGEELPQGFWPYLLLWAPWWLAIGVFYLLTAWRETFARPVAPSRDA